MRPRELTLLLEQGRPRYIGPWLVRPAERCAHRLVRIGVGRLVHHVCRHCGHGVHELVALAVDAERQRCRAELLEVLRARGLMLAARPRVSSG